MRNYHISYHCSRVYDGIPYYICMRANVNLMAHVNMMDHVNMRTHVNTMAHVNMMALGDGSRKYDSHHIYRSWHSVVNTIEKSSI